jgi:hypothetical protein
LETESTEGFHQIVVPHKEIKEQARLVTLDSRIKQAIIKSTTTALTTEEADSLQSLESIRNSILTSQENEWRLRSRATWLKSGDSNTKYFHKVASYNRLRKSIWSIMNTGGEVIRGQEAIKTEAVVYFKRLFSAQNSHNLPEKCYTAGLFPSIVTDEEAVSLNDPVTLPEIKTYFKSSRKKEALGQTAGRLNSSSIFLTSWERTFCRWLKTRASKVRFLGASIPLFWY